MAVPPTVIATVASPVPAGERLVATTFGGGVNLNTLNDTMDNAWHVAGVTRLSVEATVASGTWRTAQVLVRGSIDGTNWTTIATLTAVGFSPGLDVEDYQFVQVEVSVVEGAAGVADFASYGFTPPFEDAATGTTDVAILSPTLDTKVGGPRVWAVDTEASETLSRIAETLERIQQQLALITGAPLGPGDTL